MSTASVTLVKDEADIIEGFVRHMAFHCDRVIVMDNGSTDGTREILDGLTREVPSLAVLDDEAPQPRRQWYKVTQMAAMAGRDDWVVAADADELWTVPGGGRVRERLKDLVLVSVARAVVYDHVRTAIDTESGHPFVDMAWRRATPSSLPKVAFRWREGAVVHEGNHGVSLDPVLVAAGGPPPKAPQVLEVRHFPVRSADQLIRKVRNGIDAYADDPGSPTGWGVHWRTWGELLKRRGEDALREVFDRYHWHLSPLDAGLVYDPARGFKPVQAGWARE